MDQLLLHNITTTATNHLLQHEPLLQQIYKTAILLSSAIMLCASVAGIFAPSSLATNFGLPLLKVYDKGKAKSTSDQLRLANRRIQGWMVAFAGREGGFALAVGLLFWLREYKALSVLVQVSCVCGYADAFAAWKFGMAGAYLMHLVPTLVLGWVGPLGLWLYWR